MIDELQNALKVVRLL